MIILFGDRCVCVCVRIFCFCFCFTCVFVFYLLCNIRFTWVCVDICVAMIEVISWCIMYIIPSPPTPPKKKTYFVRCFAISLFLLFMIVCVPHLSHSYSVCIGVCVCVFVCVYMRECLCLHMHAHVSGQIKQAFSLGQWWVLQLVGSAQWISVIFVCMNE